MKKLIAILLTLMMLVSVLSVPAFAVDTLSHSIETVENESLDTLEYKVTVSGTSTANEAVTIEVVDSLPKTKVLEQLNAKDDGSFSISFTIADGGSFTVYANSYDGVTKTDTFELIGQSYYEGIRDTLNGATDAAAIKTVLDTEKSAPSLGLDMTYYNEATSDAIATNMLAYKGSYTIFNITEYFEKSVVKTYLNNTGLYSYADAIIEKYDSYLGIVSAVPSLYDDYKTFPATVKAQIISDAFPKITVPESLNARAAAALPSDVFNLSVAQIALKTEIIDDESKDTFITNNNTDYFQFDGYTDLNTLSKSSVLTGFRTADLGTTVQTIREAYGRLVAGSSNPGGVIPPGGSNPPSSGGGGGGGSSKDSIFYGSESLPQPSQGDGEGDTGFTDLDKFGWAQNAIMECATRGIVNGKAEGVFAPADNVTREEFSKMLTLAFEFYDENSAADFTDVNKDDWSYSYIASMQKAGYISGYPDGTFRGSDNISREDMAVVLHRIISTNRYIDALTNITNPFDDYESISDYARNAVLMLYNSNIISGATDSTFEPSRFATRAEACVMLQRIFKAMAE